LRTKLSGSGGRIGVKRPGKSAVGCSLPGIHVLVSQKGEKRVMRVSNDIRIAKKAQEERLHALGGARKRRVKGGEEKHVPTVAVTPKKRRYWKRGDTHWVIGGGPNTSATLVSSAALDIESRGVFSEKWGTDERGSRR